MSRIVSVNCLVRDFDTWWAVMSNDLQDLVELNAKYLVVFRSADDHDRIFVTLSLHESAAVETFIRSPNLLRWFDSTGLDDVPPIFAGHPVDKIDLREESEHLSEPAGFLVASFVRLDSVKQLQDHAHSALSRMQAAGVRRYWIYQAFDDAHEVMIMRDIATEDQARRWLREMEKDANIGPTGRFMVYPPPFVGSLVRSIEVSPAKP